MFLVNSRHRRFSATPLGSKSKSFHLTGAHLLPKLRCDFAEFLDQSSLKRLGILYQPTRVGFSTDLLVVIARFSWFSRFVLRQQIGLALAGTLEPDRGLHLKKTHVRLNLLTGRRNINPFPIDYAFQPRLRGRLTLSRLT